MVPHLLPLVFALLPGCSVALLGDAETDCQTIADAVSSLSARCGFTSPRVSSEGFCDGATTANRTHDAATGCQAWAAGVACDTALDQWDTDCDVDVTRWP